MRSGGWGLGADENSYCAYEGVRERARKGEREGAIFNFTKTQTQTEEREREPKFRNCSGVGESGPPTPPPLRPPQICPWEDLLMWLKTPPVFTEEQSAIEFR